MNTRKIADIILGVWRDIPVNVNTAARLHFLDAMGVGFAASVVGPVTGVRGMASPKQASNEGRASVFNSAAHTSASLSALINGTLIHSLEFDDTHGASIVHGSSVVAPTALAVAQEVSATGAELLAAFTMGWELMIRMGMASQGSIQANGFQTTSTVGPFGAAVVTALLHGSDSKLLANALGIAGSTPAGNFSFLENGDTTKAMQPGWAAHAGIMSFELASMGISGPSSIFAGDRGFFAIYGDDHEAAKRFEDYAADIGTKWHLPDTAFKGIACCHYIHPFVEAAEQVVKGGLVAADIDLVTCEVPVEVIDIIAEPWAARQHIKHAHEARWSLPYVVAATLLGRRSMPDMFVGEGDSEILAVAKRVEYRPWSNSGFPDRYPARISVRSLGGAVQVVEIDDVFGGSRRAMSESAVVDKAKWCFGAGGMTEGTSDMVIDEIVNATDPDVARIGRALGN